MVDLIDARRGERTSANARSTSVVVEEIDGVLFEVSALVMESTKKSGVR
jgi:hypothetical protein